MRMAGLDPRPSVQAGPDRPVAVWGRKGPARRGMALAKRAGAPLLTLEDAPLRSVRPDPADPSVGLLIDAGGVHYDPWSGSDLARRLDTVEWDRTSANRAAAAIRMLRAAGLSKYNPVPRGATSLPRRFVLVVDQKRGDASLRASGGDAALFAAMLAQARADHPGVPVLVRAHPAGAGHLDLGSLPSGVTVDLASNPWDLLDAAEAVYCHSSQLGFEAICAGHRPHVFGLPFYAGRGLTVDHHPDASRLARRDLTVEALFSGAMLDLPHWVDPVRREACDFESAAEGLRARAEAWWRVERPLLCSGMAPWKRRHVARFLTGQGGAPRFAAARTGAALAKRAARERRDLAVWASRMPADLPAAAQAAGQRLWRVEDGFLRSVGLGAELRPALSLAFDDLGIYYDPSGPSRLEQLIAARADLSADARARAARLRARIVAAGLSKYNVGDAARPAFDTCGRPRLLVVGQVEDDASVTSGGGAIRTNIALLQAARDAHPDAFILYKPHPDVQAGLRPGAVPPDAVAELANGQLDGLSSPSALAVADHVWTLTSLTGFEALLRGLKVTCLGTPFYAGWGLTDDRGPACPRRTARPELDGLVHAALIDYPLYFDPATGLACDAETAMDLLVAQRAGAAGQAPGQGVVGRMLRVGARLRG
ncbi:capsular polysaccharide biosynthesis protein [Rhodobacteraceae bacterium KN286]|uniref:Capsular polysaccharide biosynthesis protein n=2 Tax=Oceanomicrobium pacificus TaxID=2692916 RepID=A0A6B0TL35_9RHOB|nr:capsular polysaccharide biosynthesis protein [Oceanomicrobium pacificus]